MVKASGMRVGYVRVSSLTQNTDRQLDGLEIDKLFVEKASGRDNYRPQLQSMLDYVRENDEIFIHSMDRLGRSLSHLLEIVTLIVQKGCTLHFMKEKIDIGPNSGPLGRFILHIMGAVSEFEVAMIRERQREGIAIAKKAGKYYSKFSSFTPEQVEMIKNADDLGITKVDLAETLGVCKATLYKYIRRVNPNFRCDISKMPVTGELSPNKPRKVLKIQTMPESMGSMLCDLDDADHVDLEDGTDDDLFNFSEADLKEISEKIS